MILSLINNVKKCILCEGPVEDEVLRGDDEQAAAVPHVRGREEAG